MAKKKSISDFLNSLPDNPDEKKKFYKMLLSPMSLERKLDELWDVSTDDLTFLLEQFQKDEEYEICEAIKAVLDERKIGN